ncbi:MAG: peptidoglycan DD-metalloendopeptidase family protein [Alphaproteobacteria bacterium]|nr:peptidoglycan DD-metalloendopeptidase family protein [Alphaproteobacteria bacterium]
MKQAELHTRATGMRGWLCRLVLVTVGLTAGAVATPASAQSRGELEKLENEIKATRGREAALDQKSRALAKELDTLRGRLIAGARASHDGEARLTRLEADLRKTKATVRTREQALLQRRRQLTATLSVLERLSRNPPRALMLSRGKPIEVVRRTMLLRATLPTIQHRANDLREEIIELNDTRTALADQLSDLRDAGRDHQSLKRRLRKLIARKDALLKQTEAEKLRITSRMKKLAREAHNLKELFQRLEEDRPPPPRTAPLAGRDADTQRQRRQTLPRQTARLTVPKPALLRPFPRRGPITFPARGQITRRYGENTGYGNTSRGITIETRPAARIIAPHDGRVVFAGPFRGYGQILIIEHDGGYHTLLAGLAQVDGSVGQWLLAGEPVGVMARSKDGTPQLYVELRRGGQPVNPQPWFAQSANKARG